MLASPLFVICAEVHTVEKAADSFLWVIVEALGELDQQLGLR